MNPTVADNDYSGMAVLIGLAFFAYVYFQVK